MPFVDAANKLLEPAKEFIRKGSFRNSFKWLKTKPWVMDPRSEGNDEPPRDPGAGQTHTHNYTDKDYEGHRAHSLYASVNPPQSGHHRPHHRSRRRHHRHHNKDGDDDDRPITPPSQRVQFILGEEDPAGSGLEPHPLFSEMETLCENDQGEHEWRETARWVKFEEDVEEGGNRWSKPHVGTLSLHSLFELRSLILNGTVMLDMEAVSLDAIADLLLDNLINSGALSYDKKDQFREALLRRHKHLHEKNKRNREDGTGNSVARLPLIRSLAEIGRAYSTSKMRRNETFSGAANAGDPDFHVSPSGVSLSNDSNGHVNGSSNDIAKRNLQFMRKIPPGAEASNILVGEVDFLEKPVSAFIRLSTASLMGDLTEVPVPTRFIFLLLGPQGGISRYHEIGRAMATLFADEVYHDVAYKAKNRGHLLAAVDEFLDAVTVLPPGEWDPSIRIEPPSTIPSQDERRKKPNKDDEEKGAEFDEDEELKYRINSGLVRTGRLFGGLMNDIKRKAPWYLSDFKDAFSPQSIASYVFLYFACLTPIVTFGGLLSEATDTRMAAMESLVAGLISGVIYGLFSGQPLTILGSTGPMLVFEQILYDFCLSQEIDYLSFRLWVGLWIALFLLILVALDASAYVCYITRFTEENFATLIAFIFIMKAIEKVIHIGDPHEVAAFALSDNCTCAPNENYTDFTLENTNYTNFNWSIVEHAGACLREHNGVLDGHACPDLHNDTHLVHEVMHEEACSDIFLMSILLFILTFLLSINLKNFRSASFFPAKVRSYISDFGVILAIVSMTLVDHFAGIDTPKLNVPAEFKPTWSGRDWLIPFFNGNPWWTSLVTAVPAVLGVILVFMDQQITAVIVNRKEHKLKKGGGYHLDLFVLSILIAINSILGLPWFVAATVLAISHVNSLKQESETSAPGEKPQFLGVRENRVTHILIFITIGLSVLMVPLLKMIPMPVLFGVFLYMGVSALKGLQFFDRILIMFMPVKYQPDYTFLRQVPLKRVHLFTFIQLTCLIVLWVIKSISVTSILFPIMLVVMVGIRKLLEYVFTMAELHILDDAMPEFSRKKKQELDEDLEERDGECGKLPINESGNLTIPLASGNVMRIPIESVNISEELNRSGIWQGINKENKQAKKPDDHSGENGDRKHRRHRHKNGKHREPKDADLEGETGTRLSTMQEEEEEDAGITIQVGGGFHHPEDREDKL